MMVKVTASDKMTYQQLQEAINAKRSVLTRQLDIQVHYYEDKLEELDELYGLIQY